MTKISIHGDRTSGYETMIDGVDVSDQLNGLRFTVGGGTPPELVVSTGAGRVDFEVDAVVKIDDPAQELDAILRFLDGINPAGLEELMLDGDMSQSPAHMALTTLKRLAAESYGAVTSGG